jgi:hypothetical protein
MRETVGGLYTRRGRQTNKSPVAMNRRCKAAPPITRLPCCRRQIPAMVFWALLASGQIYMRKVDGWQSLAAKSIDQLIDLAA